MCRSALNRLEAVSFGAVVGLILGILAALKKNIGLIPSVISLASVLCLHTGIFHRLAATVAAALLDGKKFCITISADAGAVDVYGSDGGSIYENL